MPVRQIKDVAQRFRQRMCTAFQDVVAHPISHRQQYRSRRANPNERVNDVTSPTGRDLQLAECVESTAVDHADL